MKASAVLVTRGDVDLSQIIASMPESVIDEVIVWDNSKEETDLAVYGRYAAIERAKNDVIYVQDDDVLHSPEGIVEIVGSYLSLWESRLHDPYDVVVCNMPANFRHAFYQEHALVGFGAAFHRDAPGRAFSRFFVREQPPKFIEGTGTYAVVDQPPVRRFDAGPALTVMFKRTCDIVFTALTPRVLVDVLYDDLPWATAPNRMWMQDYHRSERQQMLDLVLKVRDAA